MTIALKPAAQLKPADVIAVSPQSAATVAYLDPTPDGRILVALVGGGKITAARSDSFAVLA